jgi:KDO2-lipid IV(A) lauroyltransferase
LNSSDEALRQTGKKKARVTKPVEWWLSRLVVSCLAHGVRLLPYGWLRVPGQALGLFCYVSMPRYRRVARANLRRAYGDRWSERQISDTARRSFCELGTTVIEALWMPRLDRDELHRLVCLEGREHLDGALERGRGAILVSAHYGNWEIMAPRLVDAGYRISTIVRDADDPGINRVLNEIRVGAGQRILPRSGATRPALACLRRNEVLALLLDQNTLKGGVFVDFFGVPAATAAGPATLAVRTGAPLVPLFCIREPDRTHRIRVLPPLYPAKGEDTGAEIVRLTASVTQAIEEQVRARPEQWTWLHNRWKLRPDGSKLA